MDNEILQQITRLLDWSAKKVGIHFVDRGAVYFEEREIWWASLGENVGSEANGKNFRFERPVVVLRKFSSDMFLAVPCTTKLKNGSWYHPFLIDREERRAVMSQIRSVSSRRLIRKLGNMTSDDFAALQNSVIGLIKTNPPTVLSEGSRIPLRGQCN
jgi:mRNA interferase MazF